MAATSYENFEQKVEEFQIQKIKSFEDENFVDKKFASY